MAQPRDGKIIEFQSERRVEPALSATADGLDGGSEPAAALKRFIAQRHKPLVRRGGGGGSAQRLCKPIVIDARRDRERGD